MKWKSPGCADSLCRGPGSSGARTFQLPVLCHHFGAPDPGAVRWAARHKNTREWPRASSRPRNVTSHTAGLSPCRMSGITEARGMAGDGTMPARVAATWPGQHPSASRAWREKDNVRWSLLSWRWKVVERVLISQLSWAFIFSKKHPSPTASVTRGELLQ